MLPVPGSDGRVPRRAGAVLLVVLLAVTAFGLAWVVRGPEPGKRLTSGNISVYYRDGATRSDAAMLLNYLKEKHNPREGPLKVQLRQQAGTYVVGLVVPPNRWDDPDTADAALVTAYRLHGGVFEGRPLRMTLCDDRFRVKRVLVPR